MVFLMLNATCISLILNQNMTMHSSDLQYDAGVTVMRRSSSTQARCSQKSNKQHSDLLPHFASCKAVLLLSIVLELIQ